MNSIFLDANILFSWNLNHLIMFFSDSKIGLVQPYWSDAVIVEAVKNIMKAERAENVKNVEARFAKMNEAFPLALVSGYENLLNVAGVDEKDQHVAKAALHSECRFLVTENIPDFIKGNFNGGLKVITPDALLTALVKKHSEKSFKATALAWWHKNSAGTFDEYLVFLGRRTSGLGLSHFEREIRSYINISEKATEEVKNEALMGEERRY